MARGQGPSGQKASVGWALLVEAPAGFRRMRRADRATRRSPPIPERTPSSEVQRAGPPGPWIGSRLMVFARKVLAPGPGTGPMDTFSWRPFQSTSRGGHDLMLGIFISSLRSQRTLEWDSSSRIAAQRRGNMISWCPVRWNPLPPSNVGLRTTLVRGR